MSWVPFCIFILFSVRLSSKSRLHSGPTLEQSIDIVGMYSKPRWMLLFTFAPSAHQNILSNPIELSSVHRLVCCSNYEVFIEFDPSLLLFWMTPRAETRDVAMWHSNFRFPSNHVYFWIYMNICEYILYICIYIYTAVYLYIYIYVHTCVYIYIHMYMCEGFTNKILKERSYLLTWNLWGSVSRLHILFSLGVWVPITGRWRCKFRHGGDNSPHDC